MERRERGHRKKLGESEGEIWRERWGRGRERKGEDEGGRRGGRG